MENEKRMQILKRNHLVRSAGKRGRKKKVLDEGSRQQKRGYYMVRLTIRVEPNSTLNLRENFFYYYLLLFKIKLKIIYVKSAWLGGHFFFSESATKTNQWGGKLKVLKNNIFGADRNSWPNMCPDSPKIDRVKILGQVDLHFSRF